MEEFTGDERLSSFSDWLDKVDARNHKLTGFTPGGASHALSCGMPNISSSVADRTPEGSALPSHWHDQGGARHAGRTVKNLWRTKSALYSFEDSCQREIGLSSSVIATCPEASDAAMEPNVRSCGSYRLRESNESIIGTTSVRYEKDMDLECVLDQGHVVQPGQFRPQYAGCSAWGNKGVEAEVRGCAVQEGQCNTMSQMAEQLGPLQENREAQLERLKLAMLRGGRRSVDGSRPRPLEGLPAGGPRRVSVDCLGERHGGMLCHPQPAHVRQEQGGQGPQEQQLTLQEHQRVSAHMCSERLHSGADVNVAGPWHHGGQRQPAGMRHESEQGHTLREQRLAQQVQQLQTQLYNLRKWADALEDEYVLLKGKEREDERSPPCPKVPPLVANWSGGRQSWQPSPKTPLHLQANHRTPRDHDASTATSLLSTRTSASLRTPADYDESTDMGLPSSCTSSSLWEAASSSAWSSRGAILAANECLTRVWEGKVLRPHGDGCAA